jgi:hypothetical protein
MVFNVVRPGSGDHSGIFVEWAELICFSIQDLGFECTISVQEIKDDATNIVIGIFYDEGFLDSLPETTILINTEPLFARLAEIGWTSTLIRYANKYRIWDYDLKNIEILAGLGIHNVQHFKFGFHPKLQRIPQLPEDDRSIDVLFYGSINDRRKDILDKLSEGKVVINWLYGAYGNLRDQYISKSKMILNLHFNERGAFEIVRLHYLLNNGVAIVPEIGPTTSIDPHYLKFVVGVPYSELVDRCISLTEHPEELRLLREESFAQFKKFPQVTYMEDLIIKNI